MFWSNQPDLCFVPIVSEALSLCRFLQVKLVDNTILANNIDKMAKIKPLHDSRNNAFIQYGFFHESLSIGESVVRYFGKYSFKIFISGKAIRVVYKIWSMCSTGVPISFENLYRQRQRW